MNEPQTQPKPKNGATAPEKPKFMPTHGHGVLAFECHSNASFNIPGEGRVQSAKADRQGVTSMHLHPAGVVMVLTSGGQRLIPFGSLASIDLIPEQGRAE